MCGIIGYTGSKDPVAVLVSGLERLEYRGYDSAGIALITHSPSSHPSSRSSSSHSSPQFPGSVSSSSHSSPQLPGSVSSSSHSSPQLPGSVSSSSHSSPQLPGSVSSSLSSSLSSAGVASPALASAALAALSPSRVQQAASQLEVKKVAGRIENLKVHLLQSRFHGSPRSAGGVSIGIAHTRWATHGQPNYENAHPHGDCSGKISLVHNGIIENFSELKKKLSAHRFVSQTDTEVIAHLIEEYYTETGSLRSAVQHAVREMQGTYALAVIHQNCGEIVVARNGSPLIIGVGGDGHLIASDVSALVEHTRDVVYLDDGEFGVIRHSGFELYAADGRRVTKPVHHIDWDVEQSQKMGFKHFMLKEIHEQPAVVKETMRISVDAALASCAAPAVSSASSALPASSASPASPASLVSSALPASSASPALSASFASPGPVPFPVFSSFKKLFVIACGSAAYAGLIGKYIIEQACRIPVEFDVASEFRYRDPLVSAGDLVIVVSQSGETADTLAALRIAKEKGAKALGIINVVNSTIAREADAVIYTRAGPEISVASTKAFLSQLIVFYKLAEKISGKQILIPALPGMILRGILDNKEQVRAVAEKYHTVYNFIYLGRNLNYPVALEGALKLKEISYIHAEGYPSGEMKHGPIALVTDDVPTIAIVPRDAVYEKMISNIQEIRARSGKVIAIATQGDEEIRKHCDDVIFVPAVDEILYPLLTSVIVQLFAYYIADFRGCDIDKPRNLAKSVTVE